MKALVTVAPSAAAVAHAKAPAGKKAKHGPVSSLAFLSTVRLVAELLSKRRSSRYHGW